jgi:DNA-binding transcriptional ArsR family regulator
MAKTAKKKDSGLNIKHASDILKAVADADRLRLILELKSGRKNVGTLAEAIGAEIVNASHHLSVLKDAKVMIVKAEKQGRFMYYSLNSEVVTIEGAAISVRLPGGRLSIEA